MSVVLARLLLTALVPSGLQETPLNGASDAFDKKKKLTLFLHTGNATFVVHRMILTTPKD